MPCRARRTPLLIVTLLALPALVLAACGGGSSSSPTETPAATGQTGATVTATTTGSPGGVFASQGGLTTIQIAQRLAPSVVRVQTEAATLDVFGQVVPQQGVGSGIIIDTDGHIVTNAHVVQTNGQNATRITVVLTGEKTVDATVVGVDAPTDLAVLKVNESSLQPATLGNSSAAQVGEDVVAMGYALGLEGAPTVSAGVLSAVGRTIREDPYSINDALQTDAGINPGNSGGPLVDAQGTVIGINTAIIQGSQNIGFSISIDMAKPIINELISSGKVQRGRLGISTVDITPSLAQSFNLPVDHGVGVAAVQQGSAAQQAGLQPNDVIVTVAGQDIQNSGDLINVLTQHKPGDKVTVEFYRNNQQMSADVTLGS